MGIIGYNLQNIIEYEKKCYFKLKKLGKRLKRNRCIEMLLKLDCLCYNFYQTSWGNNIIS